MAFRPGGGEFAVGCDDGVIVGAMPWDAMSRLRLSRSPLTLKPIIIRDVSYSPDGHYVAAQYSGSIGGVVLWDATTGRWLDETPLEAEGFVRGVAFSPDGKTLAVSFEGEKDRGVVLWDTRV